jgi:hypothetical protein
MDPASGIEAAPASGTPVIAIAIHAEGSTCGAPESSAELALLLQANEKQITSSGQRTFIADSSSRRCVSRNALFQSESDSATQFVSVVFASQ